MRTCCGYRRRAKNHRHDWVEGSWYDIILPVKAFHLQNSFKDVIEKQENFDMDCVSAVVELCFQAGAFHGKSLYSYNSSSDSYVNSFIGDAFSSEDDPWSVAQKTLSAWATVRSGVEQLLLSYPIKICTRSSELPIGPSHPLSRFCEVYKHQRWRGTCDQFEHGNRIGTHVLMNAEVDDLVPPQFVWFRQPQDPPLLDECRESCWRVPAVVDLCVKAGDIPLPKYLCMTEMQGTTLSALALAVD